MRNCKQCLYTTVLSNNEVIDIRLQKECFRSRKDFTVSEMQFLSKEEGFEVDIKRRRRREWIKYLTIKRTLFLWSKREVEECGWLFREILSNEKYMWHLVLGWSSQLGNPVTLVLMTLILVYLRSRKASTVKELEKQSVNKINNEITKSYEKRIQLR